MRVAWIALVLVLVAATPSSPAETLSPLVGEWQQYFRVESDSSVRDGRAVVSGKVLNISAWSAKRIQLLVEGLDANDRPTVQRVVWLGVDLGAGSHAFFEVPIAPAASYRVRVFAFDSPRGRWG